MGEDTRVLLKPGQRIALSRFPDGSGGEEYEIRSLVGRGSSALCYEAVRLRDSRIGKLKEFYPREEVGLHYSLERLENGQLVPRGGTVRRFPELCRGYMETYNLLNEAMLGNPGNQVLKNYIQNGEVLYGALLLQERGYPVRPTVYVWSSGAVGMGFDQYLAQVRQNPEDRPDDRLYDILETMATVTDSVRALHTAGLLHLDIKPSNFLVTYDSYRRVNPNSISLFDINTLYRVGDPGIRYAGSEGFRSQELERGIAGRAADIYSIGATLFYGLVVSKTVPDGLFREEYYPNLDQLLRHSKLITESGLNGNVQLLTRLSRILKKTLAFHPADRYRYCSELYEDLKGCALLVKGYTTAAGAVGQNRKLMVVNLEERGISDPTIVIQKLLHDHPLYAGLQGGEKQLRVLVAGSGTYGQKFIDICLQAGQMEGYSLHITAVSNTPEEDRESYLQFRPAMARFVSVDGETVPNSCGSLRFLSLAEATGSAHDPKRGFRKPSNPQARQENETLAQGVLRENPEGYHYIFVALGDDSLNRAIASAFDEGGKHLPRGRCPVFYITERGKTDGAMRGRPNVRRICINRRITPETIDPRLEQMAFNTHIAWDGTLNANTREVFARFRQNKYDYASSLAFALSVKYKLFSIGILIQGDCALAKSPEPGMVVAKNLAEAAAVFHSTVLESMEENPEAKARFETLVMLEHRRWLMDRAADGWRAPEDIWGELDLASCVRNGMVRNERDRTHPCMVASTSRMPLRDKGFTREMWDDPDCLPLLDPLDDMSLRLHRCFHEAAAQTRASEPMQDADAIQRLIAQSQEQVLQAWWQLRFCLENILGGVESDSRQYGLYEGQFAAAVARLPDDIRREITDRLKLIRNRFFPVIEDNLYRDYKAYDETLIRKMPFIMTYRATGKLGVVLGKTAPENVASATVLSPEQVCCVGLVRGEDDPETIKTTLERMLAYFASRQSGCKVSFTAICARTPAHLREVLAKLPLESLTILPWDGKDGEEALLRAMKGENGALWDITGADSAAFREKLHGAKLPAFTFHRESKRFTPVAASDYLAYIREDSCLRAQDVAALLGLPERRFRFPDHPEETLQLWQLSENTAHWDSLSRLLRDCGEEKTCLARFSPGKETSPVSMTFLLPAYSRESLEQLLEELSSQGILKTWSVTTAGGGNCRAELLAEASRKPVFGKLFARPWLLQPYYGPAVQREEGDIRVVCEELEVANLQLSCPEQMVLLETLEAMDCIRCLGQDGSGVHFQYASPRIKQLLRWPEELLRASVQLSALKTGWFDDVAGICREGEDWKLTLTKGFRFRILTFGQEGSLPVLPGEAPASIGQKLIQLL